MLIVVKFDVVLEFVVGSGICCDVGIGRGVVVG